MCQRKCFSLSEIFNIFFLSISYDDDDDEDNDDDDDDDDDGDDFDDGDDDDCQCAVATLDKILPWSPGSRAGKTS